MDAAALGRRALAAGRRAFSRETVGQDLVSGTVLGVQSVPDGLAAGLLAGVSPLAGLYAYLFGMLGAAAFTSSSFLAVQATGAMALVVNDTDLSARPDPEASLAMLGLLTGVFLLIGGALRVGRLVRFAPVSVMTGFLTAVGVNIVLGQLGHLTGYSPQGGNRLTRLLDTLAHIGEWSWPAVLVGVLTMALIGVTAPTKWAGMGLVLAVVVASGVAAVLNAGFGPSVVLVSDISTIPDGLPLPIMPAWGDIAYLLVPALSLALVCTVQGAGVSAGLPTSDGQPPDATRDILGQGVGNLVSALFRGLPVGGSLSASALLVKAGARTRLALFVASAAMAITILVGSSLVALTAMRVRGRVLQPGPAAAAPRRARRRPGGRTGHRPCCSRTAACSSPARPPWRRNSPTCGPTPRTRW